MLSSLQARGLGGYLPRVNARRAVEGMVAGGKTPTSDQRGTAETGGMALQTLLSGVPLD